MVCQSSVESFFRNSFGMCDIRTLYLRFDTHLLVLVAAQNSLPLAFFQRQHFWFKISSNHTSSNFTSLLRFASADQRLYPL
mmetsp:Transcript_71799/g.105213  ORF Transcript_71799/g.105213 Transcript_71799/m.105213 type:complete len:81 (-) Transcript_71799:461-703(-)